MTRGVAAFLAAGAAAAVAVVSAQGRRPVVSSGIAVYQDANYAGASRTFTVDVPNLDTSGLNDRISSIVVAPGEMWEVCVDARYRGACTTITDRDPNLADAGWNDRISSMRRVRGFGRFRGGGSGELGGPQIELFAGTNFSGQRKLVTETVEDFSDIGFNDRALSVRVRAGVWELCVNRDFDDCRIVEDSVANLSSLGLGRLVSSARPRPAGRRGFGR